MTQDKIIEIAKEANIYKEIGGLNFQLSVKTEKLIKFAELILARQEQPTSHDAERLKFLHSTNMDGYGYEYGVAKVRFNNGQLSTFQWALSDHSDIDAAMKEGK